MILTMFLIVAVAGLVFVTGHYGIHGRDVRERKQDFENLSSVAGVTQDVQIDSDITKSIAAMREACGSILTDDSLSQFLEANPKPSWWEGDKWHWLRNFLTEHREELLRAYNGQLSEDELNVWKSRWTESRAFNPFSSFALAIYAIAAVGVFWPVLRYLSPIRIKRYDERG